MLAREKKARVPRSSPVDNFFRHAANQCCGGKFLLLRTRHTLHETAWETYERFPPFLSFPSLFPSFRSFLLFSSPRTNGKDGKGGYDGHDGCVFHVCVYPFGITDDTLRNTRTNKSTGNPEVEEERVEERRGRKSTEMWRSG